MTGDERFRELYRSHERSVLAYLLRRTTREDAEDALAETFAIAWRRIDRIPAESELAWLYGVAMRVLANQRRGGDRRKRLLAKATSAARLHQQQSGTPPAAGHERLDRAMATLKQHDREVLRLAAWEGLGATEIAAAFGITPNAASVRLHRARNALRAAFEQVGGGAP